MGKPTVENSDQMSSVSTHFSHPHPLQVFTTPLGFSSTCAACKLDVSGVVYSCSTCPFLLHQKCYDLPQKIKHEFDKAHVLSLQPKPVYPEGLFRCDACGKQGDGFSYHCDPCGTDLHPICATLPMLLTHKLHQHKLDLTFIAPYPEEAFSCDLCKRVGSKTWLYRCNACEFDVHLSCLTAIPSVSSHQHHMIPQIQTLTASRSLPHVPFQPNNMGGFGQPRPPVMANPVTAHAAPMTQMTPYQGQMAPMNQMTPFQGQMAPTNQMTPFQGQMAPTNQVTPYQANMAPMNQVTQGQMAPTNQMTPYQGQMAPMNQAIPFQGQMAPMNQAIPYQGQMAPMNQVTPFQGQMAPTNQMTPYQGNMAQRPAMNQQMNNNNNSLGAAIAGGVAEGIAGGITQAVMQEIFGLGGGGAASGGAASGVPVTADGGYSCYGGTEAGFSGEGDVSYN